MTYKLKKVKPNVVKLLYQLLYDTHNILQDNGLNYWVDGGSFLGTIRHGGIIPWDDDIDIGIMQPDVNKFLSLRNQFKKCGYSISKVFFGYKIFYSDRELIDDENFSFPFIDVFPFKKIGNKYRLGIKAARDIWPKESWYEDEIFPLKMYDFGDFKVLGPNTYKNYFKNLYGDDWNRVGYVEYDHEVLEEVEKVKVQLTDDMRVPAKPYNQVIKNRRCYEKKKSRSKTKSKYKGPKSWMIKPGKKCSKKGKCYNNFIEDMGVYVISCKGHNKRYDKFVKFAEKADVKACKIDCVVGKEFDDDFICKLRDEKILSKNADMTAIEVSINMSHYNTWKSIANSCLNYGLVFEDDVELHEDFIDQINRILTDLGNNQIDFSILHLWNGNWGETLSHTKKILQVDKKVEILQEREEYNAGAVAYIISKDYAEFLMNKMFPIKNPQDILMGTYPKRGKHLTLRMTYDKKEKCYKSPILDNPCGGEGGTGAETTQVYGAPTVDMVKC